MSLSILIVILCTCSVIQQESTQIIVHKQASDNPDNLSHYHIVYWTPSIDTDEQGNPVGANIEYDVLSSTNTTDWMFEQRTTKTNVFITNSYPAQYYRVGAHYKL